MPDTRKSDLAKIHLAKKQLGMDDDAYRDMLWSVARVKSAADLDSTGRARVLGHLRSRGFRPKQRGRTTPAGDREFLIRKIRKQCQVAGVWSEYADGMARRMFGVERFEWCNPDQLRRIVAALNYHIKRQGK